ncbi:hypothetical protein BO78DRAFT_13061 [Aspergillus sclerotiicarbonarius CBS 121057]|uniref:Uncharacterized protein n=1 Tax=Aspergillus sclerotiicarbonarius (strain CBS 121057 / IBT 28362) TaxID=1448318 RepID=A0A319EI80_ASPSB|nr:hypothetical protein BO78DRAFT_13061 [Aspergillus sclerotiicarbonarius CBS 121057]
MDCSKKNHVCNCQDQHDRGALTTSSCGRMAMANRAGAEESTPKGLDPTRLGAARGTDGNHTNPSADR